MTLLTKKEACDKMRISLSALNTLIKINAIPFIRIGQRTMRFQQSDIEQYLQQNIKNNNSKGQGE